MSQKLLKEFYYNPNTQFTSITSLYNAVKKEGIKYDEAKEFIQN